MLIAFLYWYACKPVKQYTSKKNQYNLGIKSDALDIYTCVYHLNDSVSEVFVQIPNNNLLYKRNIESLNFDADVKVSYCLGDHEDFKHCTDTGSFYLLDAEVSEPVPLKGLSYNFKIRAKYGSNYFLKLEATDLNRKSISNKLVSINKSDPNSAQQFLIQSAALPLYDPYLVKGQHVVIQAANKKTALLTVYCYFAEHKAALPPFSNKDVAEITVPDSSFTLLAQNGQFYLMAPERGFYFIKADDMLNTGFCLFTYDAYFPAIQSSSDMIQSCRYLMYKEEYDSCMKAADKKLAIDNFWLNIGGSHERSREILKKYYQRVMFANTQFSSYKEGWKTDRGMVSIIFGSPTNVYKSISDEIWVYGIESNPAALRFIFKKNPSPFSENDFVLERSEIYKDAFYQAVDYWRQGIVYNERNADR